MLHLNYDITHLRGAEYNPRFIGEDDLARLAESVRETGACEAIDSARRFAGGGTSKDEGAM
ncbi:Uncharacterised protein [Escherichia coli]|uniref:Uncharacterized protein n=1 Tax=Escherichia coli TaxID=562 RepID=A0A377AM12_ECOLX|nr:Uncharacterised protein [Escherichia coli]